jgi:hypothetical protein
MSWILARMVVSQGLAKDARKPQKSRQPNQWLAPLRKYPFGARAYFQRLSEFAALAIESGKTRLGPLIEELTPRLRNQSAPLRPCITASFSLRHRATLLCDDHLPQDAVHVALTILLPSRHSYQQNEGQQASRVFDLSAGAASRYLYGEPGTMPEEPQHAESLLRGLSRGTERGLLKIPASL